MGTQMQDSANDQTSSAGIAEAHQERLRAVAHERRYDLVWRYAIGILVGHLLLRLALVYRANEATGEVSYPSLVWSAVILFAIWKLASQTVVGSRLAQFVFIVLGVGSLLGSGLSLLAAPQMNDGEKVVLALQVALAVGGITLTLIMNKIHFTYDCRS